MWVLPNLKSRLNTARKYAPLVLANALVTSIGMKGFCEYVVGICSPGSMNECDREMSVCKPYFDYESYCDPEELPLLAVKVKDEVIRLLNFWLDISGGPLSLMSRIYDIRFASRSRYVGNRFKASFHITVPGFKTSPMSMKALLKRAGPSPLGVKFDESVYCKAKRMCAVYCYKDASDPAVMKPYNIFDGSTLDDVSAEDLLNYFIQVVDPDWPEINCVLTAPPKKRHVRSEFSDVSDGQVREESVASAQDKIRRVDDSEAEEDDDGLGESCSDNIFTAFLPFLERFGFDNVQRVGSLYNVGSKIYISFTCDRLGKECPCCGHVHERLLWDLLVNKDDGVYSVKSKSDRCVFLVFNQVSRMPVILQKMLSLRFANPGHVTFAQMFADTFRDSLFYNVMTNFFHEFDGIRWKPLDDSDVFSMISRYWRESVLGPEMVFWFDATERLNSLSFKSDHFEKIGLRIRDFLNKLEDYNFTNNVLKTLRNFMKVDPGMLDANDDVIHFTNGALELSTLTFRDTLASDYNTKTTGYDYVPYVSEGEKMAHRSFLDKIYPNLAIQEVVQRVFGSTLSGRNNAKRIFIFTDAGSGYNGKTAVMQLHSLAMGDYAVWAKKDLLYDGVSKGADAPQPFAVACDGKRAIFVEELEPNKKLAEGSIKEWTSGTVREYPVRDLYKQPRPMRWRAKVFVGVNHGKISRFDPYDSALINRFLVIPHVSRFTSNPAEWDSLRNVYPMDMRIGEIAGTYWKMAHLNWCIDGFRRFREVGLGDETFLDRGILDFKMGFVHKNSPVYLYLGEVLEISPVAQDITYMDDVWKFYRDDRRSIKHLSKEQFAKSFEVLVNTLRPGSFRKLLKGVHLVEVAAGIRVKDGCGSFRRSTGYAVGGPPPDGGDRGEPYMF